MRARPEAPRSGAASVPLDDAPPNDPVSGLVSAKWPRHLVASLLFVFVALCFTVALTRLGPFSTAFALFNSDASIPVLMSNDADFDLFRLYFYAQDRFGALPFLLARLLGAAFASTWTPETLAVFRTCWLFFALYFLYRLAQPFGAFALAAGCTLWFALPLVREGLFGLEQVYSWALPLLLLAWWRIRLLCAEPQSPVRAGAALLAVFLAVWVASVNAIAVVWIVIVELLARSRPAGAQPVRRWFAPALSLGTVTAGVFLELLLRVVYFLYSRATYGNSFRTPLRFDFANIEQNVATVFARLGSVSAWPLLLFGILLGCSGLVALLWSVRGARSAARGRLLVAPGEQGIGGAVALVVGSGGIAAAQLALVVVVAHFRENLFDPRYFTLIWFFGGLAGAYGGATLLVQVLSAWSPFGRGCGRSWALRLAPMMGLIVAGGVVVSATSDLTRHPEVARIRERAAAVAADGERTIVLGRYWDTYVLAGVLPQARLRPLPFEGQYLRMPWIVSELRPGVEVTLITPADSPHAPAELNQYGATLTRLARPTRSVAEARLESYRVTRGARPLVQSPSGR